MRSARSTATLTILSLLVTWPSAVCLGDDLTPQSSFAQQLRQLVSFRILGGRIVAGSSRQGGTSRRQSRSGSREEVLTVGTRGKHPEVNYSLDTNSGRLEITATGSNAFSIRRQPKGNSDVVPLSFVQTAEGLNFTVGAGEDQRILRAGNLWQLLLSEPELCGKELVPLLESLRSGWNLNTQATAIREALVAAASTAPADRHQRWNELVAQLASDDFATRESSDRKLRAEGQAALSHLLRLRRSDLEPEQWFRVRRIIDSMTSNTPDDIPDRVAARMLDDPQIWLPLLSAEDAATRKVAYQRLTHLVGSIDWDPAADPADQADKLDPIRELVREHVVEEPAP